MSAVLLTAILVTPTVLADSTSTVTAQSALACMGSLEDQRETALQAGYSAYMDARDASLGAYTTSSKTAYGAKLDAESAALQAYMGSVKAAYSARQVSLKTAWAMTDKNARQAAIKAAWKAFSDATKTAQQTIKDARKSANDQWKLAEKTASDTLKGANNTAQQQWKDANKQAWNAFNTGRVSCKAASKEELKTGE